MKIRVDNVFFLEDAGIVDYALSLLPPAEVKSGWYSLKIRGKSVTTFYVGGGVHFTPYDKHRPLSIWTREIEKIRPHAFKKGRWEIEPISEPE